MAEPFFIFPNGLATPYRLESARYVESDPLRAKLVKCSENFKWSSCKAHLKSENDILEKAKPLLDLIPNLKELINTLSSEDDLQTLRLYERTSRPLGDNNFINHFKKLTSRSFKR